MPREGRGKKSPLVFDSGEINFDELMNHELTEAQSNLIKRPTSEDNFVLLNPLLKWRLGWDIFVSLMLFYNAVDIPIAVAYAVRESYMSPVFWINRIVDICFIVDIGLNFETGIYAGEEIVMDRDRVRWMYVLSWFPLDCVATIPYDLVANLAIGRAQSLLFHGSVIYGDLHLVQLLKLVRLLRLFKTVKLMTVFEKALVFRYEDIALSKFILFVFFCLHWSACLFSWLDENHCDLTEHSSFQYAAGIQDANIGPRYFAALYWALATMTTIGYGDISARCNSTRIFSLVIMLVASVVYAYGLSYVMDVMRRNNKHKSEFRELMDMANKYMDFRQIPSDLREDMRKFFNFMSESDARRNELLGERIILNQLSPELRFAVLKHVNSGLLDKVKLFQDIQEAIGEVSILQEAVLHMQYQVFSPEEVVIKEGSVSDELFFITKGTCILVKWDRITVKVLSEGSYYGELGFLSSTEAFLQTHSINQAPTVSTTKLKQQSVLLGASNWRAMLAGVVEGPSDSTFLAQNTSLHNQSFRSSVAGGSTTEGGGPTDDADTQPAASAPSALGRHLSEQSGVSKVSGTAPCSRMSPSPSFMEYIQDKSFLTQSYVDLRYITGETFNKIISMLPRPKLERVLTIVQRRSADLRQEDQRQEDELMQFYPEAHEEYMFGEDSSEDDTDWRDHENDILDETLGGNMLGMDPDIVRPAGANGIIRRVLSRKMSSDGMVGGGLSVSQAFSPRSGGNAKSRRRPTMTGAGTSASGCKRTEKRSALHHHNSLSTLQEMGVACPPSPSHLLFHRVVPAAHRSSLFFRQKSHMESQESILDESPNDLSSGQNRHVTPGKKKVHSFYGTASRGRTRSRRRTEPLPAQSSDDCSSASSASQVLTSPRHVVRDIDVLMEQLGHIKRRLSTQVEVEYDLSVRTVAVGGGGSGRTLSPMTDSTNASPVKSPRYHTAMVPVREEDERTDTNDSTAVDSEVHSYQCDQDFVLKLPSRKKCVAGSHAPEESGEPSSDICAGTEMECQVVVDTGRPGRNTMKNVSQQDSKDEVSYVELPRKDTTAASSGST